MNTKELLGLKVKEYRKLKKITQEKLSELIGVDNGYISKLEVGQNFPSIKTLEKIANVLEVDLYKLFLYTGEKDINFKIEINKIYDELNKEKQFALYSIAKAIKN
ncbi:helix-turn-helix transcriptional regulator [bacterium]|nr:helix-turn-helix transcriptional regulator [bacterium]